MASVRRRSSDFAPLLRARGCALYILPCQTPWTETAMLQRRLRPSESGDFVAIAPRRLRARQSPAAKPQGSNSRALAATACRYLDLARSHSGLSPVPAVCVCVSAWASETFHRLHGPR